MLYLVLNFWTWTRTRKFWNRNSLDLSPEKNYSIGRYSVIHQFQIESACRKKVLTFVSASFMGKLGLIFSLLLSTLLVACIKESK